MEVFVGISFGIFYVAAAVVGSGPTGECVSPKLGNRCGRRPHLATSCTKIPANHTRTNHSHRIVATAPHWCGLHSASLCRSSVGRGYKHGSKSHWSCCCRERTMPTTKTWTMSLAQLSAQNRSEGDCDNAPHSDYSLGTDAGWAVSIAVSQRGRRIVPPAPPTYA